MCFVVTFIFFVLGLILINDILAIDTVSSSPDFTTIRIHHIVPHDSRKLRARVCEVSGDSDFCHKLKEHVDEALDGKNSFYFYLHEEGGDNLTM